MQQYTTIARRAQTLFARGYALAGPLPITGYDVYTVTSPAGASSGVFLSDTPADLAFGDRCECPAFEQYGECKHHLAVLARVRDERCRDEQQAADHDAGEADRDAFSFDVADYEFRNFCEAVN